MAHILHTEWLGALVNVMRIGLSGVCNLAVSANVQNTRYTTLWAIPLSRLCCAIDVVMSADTAALYNVCMIACIGAGMNLMKSVNP